MINETAWRQEIGMYLLMHIQRRTLFLIAPANARGLPLSVTPIAPISAGAAHAAVTPSGQFTLNVHPVIQTTGNNSEVGVRDDHAPTPSFV